MASTAETYRQAALEHLGRAQRLYDEEHFFESHYFFGLAVECHLRAYLRRVSDDFDPRHNLDDLAKHARFFNIVPRELSEHFSTMFATLNTRWRANHRYFSERQLLDYMNVLQAEFHVKGDR